MNETPFTVVKREDLVPICPHCEEPIAEVYVKSRGAGWFLFPSSSVYFCPHCMKVLGIGQSRMA